ncbi:hypothetical protein VTJ83DRAFT_6486 [Remersonia thermophila]|uniref:Uncharacterized protein n=1 Tax=Remersonia thermophila TaxID=72144 RepID=A0ABR4D6C7_9PEZI
MEELKSAICEEHEISLATLVRVLQGKGYLEDVQDARPFQAQLVLVLLGWLTMLYSPALPPREGYLELDRGGLNVSSATWVVGAIPLSRGSSLAGILRNFGTYGGPIPGTRSLRPQNQASSPRSLESANISFHTLRNVAGIRILWTSSSCEHLELDLRDNVLKLFRHPLFCAIMAVPKTGDDPGPKATYLSRCDVLGADTAGAADAEFLSSRDQRYHREIVLTFRIIFGQDSASMVNRLSLSQYQPRWWQWRWWRGFNDNMAPFLNEAPAGDSEGDPLLARLCGEDWRRVDAYEHVRSGPAKAAYAVDEELPHFADRLMALQEFVKTQNPGGFWTLLKDRRDMNRLWTIRSAVLLGIGVAVLSVLQLLVGIAQLVVAIQDLRASG